MFIIYFFSSPLSSWAPCWSDRISLTTYPDLRISFSIHWWAASTVWSVVLVGRTVFEDYEDDAESEEGEVDQEEGEEGKEDDEDVG